MAGSDAVRAHLGLVPLVAVLVALLPSPTTAAARAHGEPAVEGLLEEVVDAGVPGTAARIRSEDGRWQGAAGAAQLDPLSEMQPDLRYRIGSLTKTFVATVVLQLVDEGVLTLDDTLAARRPGTGIPHADRITLRQLLNHTAGVFNYTEDPAIWEGEHGDDATRVEPETLVAIAAEHEPPFAPGEGWRYSNTGYILLGLVVESATGRAFEDELQERILAPLDLTHTSLPAEPSIAGAHARGYQPEGYVPIDPEPPPPGAALEDVTAWNPSWAWAAGGIVSTQRDVERFYRALLRGRLLPSALFDEMTTMVSLSPTSGYGLGISQIRGPCGTVVGHTGGVPGYVNAAFLSPDGRRSMTLLMNLSPFTDAQGELVDLTLTTAICQMYGAPEPAAKAGYEGHHLRTW